MKKLAAYAAKRDFTVTPEPTESVAKTGGRSFVVQKHAARRLHYDFRLELDGVLKSWAVPKGPTLAPAKKRLAVEVEDHPVDYREFEGTIPKGQYGAGEVIVWDRGTWAPVGDPHRGLREGRLHFVLQGEKLKGAWSLVRVKPVEGEGPKASWLLIKSRDEHAKGGDEAEITERLPKSVLTGRSIEELAAGPPSHALDPRTAPAISWDPATFTPQLATAADCLPKGDGWVFELKLDGYRALAIVGRGKARIMTRNGLDWTARFPLIADALPHVRVRDAVFDGEIVVADEEGRTSFQRLQSALSAKAQADYTYVIFDLLARDGQDLRPLPLVERKAQLATILAGEKPPLVLSRHVADEGETILAEVRRRNLEGVIAKRADAPYSAGRTRSWLKIKCARQQEFIIVGYVPLTGKRGTLGALVLGVRDNRTGRLRIVGKVGTGFTVASRRALRKRLERLERTTPPVVTTLRPRDITWVEPETVCQVRFDEWTRGGALRHPVFLGLREDKSAHEVVREPETRAPRAATMIARRHARSVGEEPVVVEGVTITHASRIVDGTSGFTKGDLARYFDAVANHMLPEIRERPLAVVRCPVALLR